MTKKLKICYVITKGNWGGAQKYVYNLATALPKDQYDVFVICGEGEVLKNKLEEKGIKVYELTNLKRNISFFREYKSSLAMLKIIYREKPDVLHLNSPKASGFGSVAGRLVGTGVIIQTIHGFAFNEDRNVLSKALIYFFSWLTIVLCHKTIVINSKEERQTLAMPFVSKNEIILIPNGVDKINFKERNIARRELLSMIGTDTAENILLIGTTAELHKNKGLEYALEAVSKITTPFVYLIIGEGEERKSLENLIKKLGLDTKVFLVGFLDEASQYLKAFDIFLLPSIKEGLPYTLLEAGYIGLPCVSTNVGGIPDIIENNVSGIMTEKGNSDEITKALESLISNPDKRTILGQNLKQKVESKFSFGEMVEKTIILY